MVLLGQDQKNKKKKKRRKELTLEVEVRKHSLELRKKDADGVWGESWSSLPMLALLPEL